VRPEILVFVSASMDKKDKEVIQWFSNLIRELEMQPIFAAHLPEPRPPLEKIKDLIQKSHALVAIFTRRDKIEGKNLWKGPEWIQNEITFAESYDKPIAVFAETQVDIREGIVPWITEYVIFDRENLSSYKRKVKIFLKTLKVHALKKLPSEEGEEIGDTIVEDVEESFFDKVLINVGKSILKWKYKRLDVSLWKFYMFLGLIAIIPAYLIYDYFWGSKMVEAWVATICIVILCIEVGIVSLTGSSRCEKCKSYFSWREKPVRISDIRKFEVIPEGRRLKKYVCEVCGYVRYKFVGREE
jgi:hypothetical protein